MQTGFLFVLALVSIGALAVDQSKFRTCDQTSFCRRHRHQHSQVLYDYALDKDTVKFHIPGELSEAAAGAAAAAENAKDEQSGMWQSLSNRILGGSKASDENAKDPYVRGPPPTVTAILRNTAPETSTGSKTEHLEWSVHAMADGLVRMRITEPYQTPNAPYEKARVTYDELVLSSDSMAPAGHAQLFPAGVEKVQELVGEAHADNHMALQYGDSHDVPGMLLLIRLQPFAAFLYRESDMSAGPIVSVGEKDMFHFEIRRHKDDDGSGNEIEEPEEEKEAADQYGDTPEKEIVGYWEDGLAIYADGTREERKVEETDTHRKLTEDQLDREGMWEESFQGHPDSKPFGPMSVGMDIGFPGSKHLFGLPEHASSNKLKTTTGPGQEYSDPYRLYNLDVFEYDLDVPMSLYGAVPLIISQSLATGTAGAFWFNPSETFVDIMDDETNNGQATHWISESGIVDLFLIPGPTPQDFYRQYATLTGKMPLPPMFSLGYHQCRWNYKDEADVYNVHGKFEELDYPYDVLWLDIEHTDGKRYFTWDDRLFKHPKEMQEKLWSEGRRMVTIIDPHVKRDNKYYIHKEATAKGLYIKNSDGKADFDGWCWPGASSYLDFTAEHVRSWWADQFSYDRYKGSTPSLFTWNDMNEFSVFNGPEVTAKKDLRNLRGDEHREWHNLYGMLFHRATGEGQIRRSGNNARPFVLSRSFFAGSQKYGAIWTGDNAAEWSHLEIASPMLLSMNAAALSFVGADVGGFFGNTDAELMTRWMQAGAYTPFFRGHAHHDSKRREPWVFGDEVMVRLRKAAMARYALLPHWYDLFHEAGVTGMPVMRSMWMQYPNTESLFGVDDQYMVGADLLVKPVTAPNVQETVVKFPSDDKWYDAETFALVSGSGQQQQHKVSEIVVPSDIDTIPVFQRGGSIIPRKLWLRRSSEMMKTDPYTLYVALDDDQSASGFLYMDDEETFQHVAADEFAKAHFSFSKTTMTSKVELGVGWVTSASTMASLRMVERIVIMGLDQSPKSIVVSDEARLVEFASYVANGTSIVVIRKPEISAMLEWSLDFLY
eukprot:CAMPEP_0119563220 /NCGR_PEP_ID=MMETSP1352-20130426/22738_1 /TAXON_ID=265584 /ORGANISM="Stauroneis constricta, Strain CCMP1120" /LENGTH=1054 /DNA_ID=CAMNT_0007611769 /DNA_START=78 /DNA_END=3242 /DNA_ORIENTATION=-